jgi:MoxR-like ATPase
MNPELIQTYTKKVIDNCSRVIVGKDEVIRQILVCFLCSGHVLLEDVPGTGKTMLLRAFSKTMGGEFRRIQFTPDLLPSDLTGIHFYNQKESEFEFRPGPLFAGMVLADEINRATPRTQSALLECMAEGQVTVDGVTRKLPDPFFVAATQNPVETLGTYPLPEAQMDRFLMRIRMGKMDLKEECAMIDRFIEDEPLSRVAPCTSAEEINALRLECRKIFVHADLRAYIASLVLATRSGSGELAGEGVSPRGTLALVRAAQGYAMTEGRDYVVPEDVKALAMPVLVHRCLLLSGGSEEEKQERVRNALNTVPVPTENWRR